MTAGEQNTTHLTFMPEQDRLPAPVAARQRGGIGAANALARSITPSGSNGWAIGPPQERVGERHPDGQPPFALGQQRADSGA